MGFKSFWFEFNRWARLGRAKLVLSQLIQIQVLESMSDVLYMTQLVLYLYQIINFMTSTIG